jgi:hypothetical protein
LYVIISRGIDFGKSDDPIKVENEDFLEKFAEDVEGLVLQIEDAVQYLLEPRSRSVLQRTCFRGTLQLSPEVQIPVYNFLSFISEAKFRFIPI